MHLLRPYKFSILRLRLLIGCCPRRGRRLEIGASAPAVSYSRLIDIHYKPGTRA
jgi:hypothetical protein